ncbi:arylsulfatase [Nitrosococcus watsonii]|uniref:Sulfatase n=1 Tax=Nitrosococcus watsoni (strain C-113) TaxID=105559 RepID=D8K9Z6_NITWC|nr:arylsulfatase [Nitrosococcus watsonii]ADJ29354.1 sulfatase [Nitrosococcus watsonii C-113]
MSRNHPTKLTQALLFPLALLATAACYGELNRQSEPLSQTVPSAQERANLPLEDPPFKGKIGKTYKESTPDFPKAVEAPKGAPNVVLILIDDLGFGQPGTFGGPVPTPELDQLASEGLRYNRFHTVGVCSPTRAALLTGRNHHSVGFGTIVELSTGYPGYNSLLPRDAVTVAHTLRENGYSTAMFGKNHNTPDWESNPVGPYTHWPMGWGFETFYGFNGAATSQWEPQLYYNTQAVEPDKSPEEGYHLTTDLVDHAIDWIDVHESVNPEKPYFVYLSTGATHAPHHAPKEWIDKFKGQFDQGWDKLREQTLERQKKLGVVPQDTKLTPRPEEIRAWNSLSADEKRLYAHQMEVFAGFVAHTDHEIGRFIQAIENSDDADNTLIIYIAGDNGASPEGGPTGTLNEIMTQNGIPGSVEEQLSKIDELGSPLHENHYAVGWSWAGSSPFQWMKRVPSHFGATRNGMVVSWPKVIEDKGGLRDQFTHVVDVVPTILHAAHIPIPAEVDGIEQIPMAGVDMSSTFASADADEVRTTQYFETGGHRAIYHDGWVAANFHGAPWVLTGSVGFTDPKYNTWQLYNIDEDFSEANDLAAKYPDKLNEMVEIFDQEAKKYQVYPLDDRFAERAGVARPSVTAGRTKFTYSPGTTRIPEGSAPPTYQRSHKISAKVNITDPNTEGVIIACGGTGGGYTLYVKDGKLHYTYNYFGRDSYHLVSPDKLPMGEVEVAMNYVQSPFKPFVEPTGGEAELFVNGKSVAKGAIEKMVPARFSATETMDIGKDLGSPVAGDYREQRPFAFTGKIENVIFEVAPTQPVKK